MLSKLPALARRTTLAALGAVGLALAIVPVTAPAYDPSSKAAINVGADNLILRGYDAVAYQAEGKAVIGSAEFSATYNGATYHFASAANRDAFQADPARYEPAYGGFCAMGAALNKKLDGDPLLFRVVDGRTYLNVSADAAKVWTADIPGNISKADANWPGIKDKAPQEID